MSDEQDPNRMADIKISRAQDGSYYKVDVAFQGHIFAAVKWDDRVPEAREEVLNLLRDSQKLVQSAFLEIDVEKGRSEDLDAEWAYWDSSGDIRVEDEPEGEQ